MQWAEEMLAAGDPGFPSSTCGDSQNFPSAADETTREIHQPAGAPTSLPGFASASQEHHRMSQQSASQQTEKEEGSQTEHGGAEGHKDEEMMDAVEGTGTPSPSEYVVPDSLSPFEQVQHDSEGAAVEPQGKESMETSEVQGGGEGIDTLGDREGNEAVEAEPQQGSGRDEAELRGRDVETQPLEGTGMSRGRLLPDCSTGTSCKRQRISTANRPPKRDTCEEPFEGKSWNSPPLEGSWKPPWGKREDSEGGVGEGMIPIPGDNAASGPGGLGPRHAGCISPEGTGKELSWPETPCIPRGGRVHSNTSGAPEDANAACAAFLESSHLPPPIHSSQSRRKECRAGSGASGATDWQPFTAEKTSEIGVIGTDGAVFREGPQKPQEACQAVPSQTHSSQALGAPCQLLLPKSPTDANVASSRESSWACKLRTLQEGGSGAESGSVESASLSTVKIEAGSSRAPTGVMLPVCSFSPDKGLPVGTVGAQPLPSAPALSYIITHAAGSHTQHDSPASCPRSLCQATASTDALSLGRSRSKIPEELEILSTLFPWPPPAGLLYTGMSYGGFRIFRKLLSMPPPPFAISSATTYQEAANRRLVKALQGRIVPPVLWTEKAGHQPCCSARTSLLGPVLGSAGGRFTEAERPTTVLLHQQICKPEGFLAAPKTWRQNEDVGIGATATMEPATALVQDLRGQEEEECGDAHQQALRGISHIRFSAERLRRVRALL